MNNLDQKIFKIYGTVDSNIRQQYLKNKPSEFEKLKVTGIKLTSGKNELEEMRAASKRLYAVARNEKISRAMSEIHGMGKLNKAALSREKDSATVLKRKEIITKIMNTYGLNNYETAEAFNRVLGVQRFNPTAITYIVEQSTAYKRNGSNKTW